MYSEGGGENAEIRKYAIQRLAKLFKHQDDLKYKLDTLKNKLTQEKLLIDAQLSADVQRQFDDVQEGLELLSATGDQIKLVRTEMKEVDALCFDAQSFLSNYDRIKKISIVHKNFEQAEAFYVKFKNFNERCLGVGEMLREANINMEKYDYNLLKMHYQIYQLEDFREQAVTLTVDCDEDVRETLTDVFLDFDNIRVAFEHFFWEVARKLYELGSNGQQALIIQLLKVIEMEERADLQSKKEQEKIKENNKKMGTNRVYGTAGLGGFGGGGGMTRVNGRPERKIKGYKEKFLGIIGDIVKGRIEEFFQEVANEEEEVVNSTGLVIDDLMFVTESIAPCFPAHYDIFNMFVMKYHSAIIGEANTMAEGSHIEGRTILQLLRWAREYHSMMRKELGVSKEILVPMLLGDREEDLVAQYLGLVVGKVHEWVMNLMRTETKEFLERSKPPETGEGGGQYVMQGSVIMFEIINQQIDLAVESNRGKLLVDLVVECNKIFKATNTQWLEIISAETTKQIDRPDEAAEGLVDYLMALANDQLRCVEFAEAILTRLCEQLSRSYQERLSTELGLAMEGFMEVAQRAIVSLAEIVFSDLKPIFTAQFSNEWYGEDLLQPVIETLRDYCNDFGAHLHEFLYSRIMAELLEKYVANYIDSIHHKSVRFKKGKCVNKINNEIETMTSFFAEYMLPADSSEDAEQQQQRKLESKELVNKSMLALTMLVSIIDATPTMIFLEYFSMLKTFPDVPLILIEDILTKRDDMERSQIKSIMENLKAKTSAESNTAMARSAANANTVFSKLIHYNLA